LILIVAARGPQRHERLTVSQHDAGRERVSRSSAWPQLSRAGFVQPELLSSHAHADAGVPQNHRARNPTAARRAVEDVAFAIDDRDVRGVLDGPAKWLGIRGWLVRTIAVADVGHPIFPLFHPA